MEKLEAKIVHEAIVGTVTECIGRIEFVWVGDGTPFEVAVSTSVGKVVFRQAGEPGFDDLWSHAARAASGDNLAAQKLLGMEGARR